MLRKRRALINTKHISTYSKKQFWPAKVKRSKSRHALIPRDALALELAHFLKFYASITPAISLFKDSIPWTWSLFKDYKTIWTLHNSQGVRHHQRSPTISRAAMAQSRGCSGALPSTPRKVGMLYHSSTKKNGMRFITFDPSLWGLEKLGQHVVRSTRICQKEDRRISCNDTKEL